MAQQEWHGTVVEKSRGLLDGANLYRRVVVRLDDGNTIKVRVNRPLWDSLEPGDSVSKQAGADPTKD
ncbi:hypothetical protein NBRGN_096_00230 [Nocardia brasiliensis NBRC 14402]|uniref:DUF7489 domain-containing protein n=1 Tax=Nocardia brasiliensis TaxID=37326 RepID=UPI0003170CE6|nr:hypothetical protein [Nocardia brasiliensis]ASF06459.1 hypothetical protein CEQ30_02900 [Nocardia brasiliensis]GAJ85549.1 hypothetical protein NBRGN_096_00230 [Nocardia brasiliensis NBRC 14402]SUB48420.1 Uncharacterised protein [Nocardia brasiliensis]